MKDDAPSQALPDLVFHVLLALGQGPTHGYAIGKDVEEQSGGRLDPTTGALYQVLRRLADEGLVAPVSGPDDVDPRRKYFALTRAGTPCRGAGGRTSRRAGARRAAAQALSATSVTMRIYRWLLRSVSARAATRLRRGDGGDVRAPHGRRGAIGSLAASVRVVPRAGRPARPRRSRNDSAPPRGCGDDANTTLWPEGRNHGRHCTRDSAGGTTTRSQRRCSRRRRRSRWRWPSVRMRRSSPSCTASCSIRCPIPMSERLIALDYGIPSRNIPSGINSMAWQLYFQLVDQARTLEGVAVYSSGRRR